jgi:outer membrane protein
MKRKLLLTLLLIPTTVLAQEKITVEQVIALAVEHNYDIKISKNVAELSSIDQEYVYGAFLPRVNGTGSMIWNQNNQKVRTLDRETNAVTERTGETSSNNLAASVLLNWTIFDGGRMFATKSRVNTIADQGELLVKNQVTNTIASVITNYYNVVRQKQQLKALQEQLAVSEVRVQLAERKFQVGTGAKPELLQARVDYNAQRTQAIQQESVIRQLKQQLNGLVGMKLPTSFDISDTIIIDMNLRREDIESNIEEKNFSLQASKRNVTIAGLEVRERRAERFPFLDITSSYNFSRTDNTQLVNPYSPLFSMNRGFNYGLTLSAPIFNGFNQRRLVQQSRVTLMQQENLYDQQKIDIDVSLQNAFTNYENAQAILRVEEENITFARENVTIALEVFRRGASTFVELRTAQETLADAYTRLINARYLAKAAETELLRLNGSLLR